jgi:hypothetical protein
VLKGKVSRGVMASPYHAPAIGMTVAWVAPHPGTEEEALATAGADDLPSRQTAQVALGEGHRSEWNGHQWRLRRLQVFGNGVAVFTPCLSNHLDGCLEMCACFLLGIPPRGRAIGGQSRTMGRPPILIRLDHYPEGAGLQAAPLDC